MKLSTIIFWAVVIGAIWWFFFKRPPKSATTKVTYTDTKTGQQKTVTRERRKPQNRVEIEKPESFEITEEIRSVLNTLEDTNSNVFLTGKAGTGKSTLLRYFRATTRKYPVVVAPTGIAAVNVQGQTIHSFFGWGPDITPDRVRRASYERGQIYRRMKMLIIDEISMVRADLFECIDKFLRLNTGNPNLPFGGIQIVAIGDLYQLPPVVTGTGKRLFEKKYKSPFFFSTDAYHKAAFKKFELGKVYRQKDQKFIFALNAIREGVPTENHIQLLNTAVVTPDESDDLEDHIYLVTTNKMATEINDSRMKRLPAEPKTYVGTMSGTFTEKNAPTEIELTLKSGAHVMLLNNDKQGRWVNGDVVTVLETRPNSILVEFEDGTVEDVGQHSWETIRFIYDEEEQKIVPTKIGSFTQIPAKPAWAVTIHKAQGKTFEKVFIDLGSGAFAAGQTYVALSRCKSLDGLKLAAPLLREDVFVNPHVRDFMSFAHGDASRHKAAVTRKNIHAERKEEKQNKNNNRPQTKARLTHEEFVLQAIKKLRTGNYKGIHAVYSGFNEAFRKYFNEDPIEATEALAKKGIVVIKPAKGGVIIYDAREFAPNLKRSQRPNKPLDKILGS